jgi:hypothetical protein
MRVVELLAVEGETRARGRILSDFFRRKRLKPG